MKVVADADAIGGVLVFRSGDATVVTDATQRATPETLRGAGAHGSGRGRRPGLDAGRPGEDEGRSG